MRSDKKHIIYRAIHEKRAVGDGTCEPLELRTRETSRCQYLIHGVVGLNLCNQSSKDCKYIKYFGLETICEKYKELNL